MHKGEGSAAEPGGLRRYRILSKQSLSAALAKPVPFYVKVGEYNCHVFFKPIYEDPSRQRVLGGSVIHLEYEANETDMLRAASLGIRLTEDVLAGLAVITGMPFGGVSFVQLMDVTIASSTPFLLSITPPHLHADEPITELQLSNLRQMLAHWDVLPRGARLRRAAGLYRLGLQQNEDLDVFQYVYIGLEALEPALAEQLSVNSGFEETKGKCENCGAEFVRRRTVLNGVRAYIKGQQHPETLSPERNAEWHRINDLRHKQFHGLADPQNLRSDARDVVPAAVHSLHDAICCLSHAHTLESNEFRLVRGSRRMVSVGTAEPGIEDALEDCRPVVELSDVGWDAHPAYGFVPRFNFLHDRTGVSIKSGFFWLSAPMQLASESDLERATFESL
jgi:hypothetical protein